VQPAKPVATANASESLRFSCRRPFLDYRWRLRERRLLGERAVRPVLVVMLRVDANHAREVTAA
jgi:hypothetical protein